MARKTITQDAVYEVCYVCDAVFSPDGASAAYVVAEVKGKGDKERQELSIWLVDIESGERRRLTLGKGGSYHPRFSKDGSNLYFLSTREKLPQIYCMPVAGGEAEAVTQLPQGAGPFEITPDGKSIVFATLASPPAKPSDDDNVRVSAPWYRFDPVPGYLKDVKQALFVMRIGREPKAVTEAEGLILSFAISPDSKRVVLARTAVPGHEFFDADLELVTLGRKPHSEHLLASNIPSQMSWSEDGASLVYVTNGKGLASQQAVFVLPIGADKPQNRTSATDIMIGTAIQAHNPARIQGRQRIVDGKLYTTATVGGEANLVRVSLTGRKRVTPISAGQRITYLMDERGGNILHISQDPLNPPALCMTNIESGDERVIADHNTVWREKYLLPDVERVVAKSERKVEIEGWVLKPKRGRAPYRTILSIHGGPHAGYGYAFAYDFLELVGEGYAVAFMNPRGSTGYGEAFTRSILGVWGHPELKDFHAFLDELVRRKISHPDKLGVTGISGGGHLSGWLIGHTDRFKAAVPEQGVYNMLSMWGTSDAGKALIEIEMGGPLHKIPMKYWELSPIAYAHKCKTPTLLLQGEDDIRCPMEQAEQLYAALEHHGCEVELIRMKNCNHGAQVGGRTQLRRFRMDVMKDWFARHIR